MERFEAEHWSGNSFDKPMVLFDDFVEVFRLNNADDPANAGELEDGIEALQAGKISATLVDDNAFRDTVGGNGTFKKRQV